MPTAPKIVPLAKPKPPPRPAGSTTERGYGHAHQKLRAALLELYPLCQRCGDDWSAHLHHRNRDPHDRRRRNLEVLCERCHRREHAGA